MSKTWVSLLVLSFYFSCASCGKVLLWPMEYNHCINLKTIWDELAQRDHEVTVLVSSPSLWVPISHLPLNLRFTLHPSLRMSLICFLQNGSRYGHTSYQRVHYGHMIQRCKKHIMNILILFKSSVRMQFWTKNLWKNCRNTDLMFLDMPFLLVSSCCLNYLTYLWSTVFDLPLTIQMKNSAEGSYYLLPMYLLSYQNLVTKGHLWRW